MENTFLLQVLLYPGIILTIISVFFAATQSPSRGEWFWAGANGSLLLALVFFTLRSSVSPLLSIVIGNALFTVGFLLLEAGMRVFQSRRIPWIHYGGWLALFIALLVVFTFPFPSLNARIVLASAYTAVISLLVGRRLLQGFSDLPRPIPVGLGVVFLLIGLYFAARIPIRYLLPSIDPYFGSAAEPLTAAAYALGIGAWASCTVGLIILKNQMLHAKAEAELHSRTDAQQALERNAERLRSLNAIYQSIVRQQPVDMTSARAVERFVALVSGSCAAVVLFDSKESPAYLLASAPDRALALSVDRLPIGLRSRLVVRFADTPHPLVARPADDSAARELLNALGLERAAEVMIAPVSVGEELVGVLCAVCDSRERFAASDLEVGAETADSVSIALHNDKTRSALIERASELELSLEEKEVLLKEVHHRVKNNLQIISSLLYLQSANVQQPELRAALREMQNRVRSIVFVHERLYRSTDLSRVRFTDYVREFTQWQLVSYGVEPARISCVVEDSDVLLGAEIAVPLGLIINELVANSLKHAFPDGRTGAITISLRTAGSSHLLTVADDGVGIPSGDHPAGGSGIGLEIISVLVRQIRGTIAVSSERGTRTVVAFPAAESALELGAS